MSHVSPSSWSPGALVGVGRGSSGSSGGFLLFGRRSGGGGGGGGGSGCRLDTPTGLHDGVDNYGQEQKPTSQRAMDWFQVGGAPPSGLFYTQTFVPSSCLWTRLSSFRMDVISCGMEQSRGSFRFRRH